MAKAATARRSDDPRNERLGGKLDANNSPKRLDSQGEAPGVCRPGFDRVAVAAHVGLLHKLAAPCADDGILILIAIEDGEPRPQHFKIGDAQGMVEAIMAFEHHPTINLYSPLAVMRPDLERGKKGGEADIVAVLAAVGDIDNDKNERLEVDNLPLAPAYVIEFERGQLSAGFPIREPASSARSKARAQSVRRRVGGRQRAKRRFACLAHRGHVEHPDEN